MNFKLNIEQKLSIKKGGETHEPKRKSNENKNLYKFLFIFENSYLR